MCCPLTWLFFFVLKHQKNCSLKVNIILCSRVVSACFRVFLGKVKILNTGYWVEETSFNFKICRNRQAFNRKGFFFLWRYPSISNQPFCLKNWHLNHLTKQICWSKIVKLRLSLFCFGFEWSIGYNQFYFFCQLNIVWKLLIWWTSPYLVDFYSILKYFWIKC